MAHVDIRQIDRVFSPFSPTPHPHEPKRGGLFFFLLALSCLAFAGGCGYQLQHEPTYQASRAGADSAKPFWRWGKAQNLQDPAKKQNEPIREARIAKVEQEQQFQPRTGSTAQSTMLSLEEWVHEGLRDGVFYSVDVDANEIRMDPVKWSWLSIEQKQMFVRQFSRYFDAKASTARVNILSSRNDTKLGSYSVWTGIRIYE